MLLNLFQVRLRAKDVPEGHVAEGTVWAEPEEIHPGDEFQVSVEVKFPEGGAPGSIEVRVSPPEDMTVDVPQVDIGPEGATVTIPAVAAEEVELGTYYLQVVYSDDEREHFEAEAPLEVKRHWVRIGKVEARPERVSPGDPVDVAVPLSFEGQARVRGHVRGRLVPEEWDGSDEHAIKLPRERSSVSGEREQIWHIRLPRGVPEGRYNADIEFSSQEGTARKRTRRVLLLVPQRGIDAIRPTLEPSLLAPGDDLTIRTTAENIGREDLLVRVGGDLVPESGGNLVPLEERDIPLAPGESQLVEWAIQAPERHGRWMVRTRARAERTDGADPPVVVLDVRPHNKVHVVGAVPAKPWAAVGERVNVSLQLTDSGSRPGSDATISVSLEGETGEVSEARWSGSIDVEIREAIVTLEVPHPPSGSGGDAEEPGESQTSTRFALVVREVGGEELLRIPGAVAVRKRVQIDPRVVKAMPDPTKLGDCMLPGEKVLKTFDSGDLTIVELSSGSRLYARGDQVVGVDDGVPMDEAFWDEALSADAGRYTDLRKGLQLGAQAARAEAIAMSALGDSLAHGEGSASGLIKDTRELVKSLDPDRRARGVSPRSGPLAPLAAWLYDQDAPPDDGREIILELRKDMVASQKVKVGKDAAKEASAAAKAASDHLERLADLFARAWEQDRLHVGDLGAMTALVTAAGVAEVELNSLRQESDPWASSNQLIEEGRATLQAMSVQLAALVEVIARHRIRRHASTVNTRQRASHAAVVRDLEVAFGPSVGHSGDATELEIELSNHSPIDLELRLNIALPSGAWAVLEPQARGAEGIVFVGPFHVPAHTQETVKLVLYVPSTVRLDSYVLPIEIVPDPKNMLVEQRGGAK
jgi:hypothetical protein